MTNEQQHVAWAGWQLAIPATWRPWHIEGNRTRGSFLLGNQEQGVINLHWWQENTMDPHRWLHRRLKKKYVSLLRTDPKRLDPAMRELGWLPETAPHSGRPPSKGIWYGYHPASRLVFELVLNWQAEPQLRRIFLEQLLPSLTVGPAQGERQWSVFNTSFTTPAGFDIAKQSIRLGDLSFEFRHPDGSWLLLRQVYPAELALARREMVQWLEFTPFKTYCRYHYAGQPENWSQPIRGGLMPALKRKGHKQLPFPLQVFLYRHSIGAVVHDRQLNRLLVAEFDSPRPVDETPLITAFAGMNGAARLTEN